MEALAAALSSRWAGSRLEGVPGLLAAAGITSASVLRSTADGDFVKLIGELLNMGPSELSPVELAEVAHLEKVAGRLAEAEQRARDAEPYTGLADVVEFYKRRKIELKKAASEDLVSVPPQACGLVAGGFVARALRLGDARTRTPRTGRNGQPGFGCCLKPWSPRFYSKVPRGWTLRSGSRRCWAAPAGAPSS